MRDSAPHILVVDDDPAVIEALTAALKATYVVHGAATGKEACAILRAQPIAAIIPDATLGEEHGLDLVERFRVLSRAPILMLTGHGSEELAIRALRAKVDDYLRKPVNLKALRATLSRWVQEHGPLADPVARARRILVEDPERPHSTASLAKDVGLSERHFRRQFRAAYGKTVRRYLTEVRMQRAAALLRETRLGIEQVAHTVGYPSIKNFARSFRRAYGLTPSEFRAHEGSPEVQTSSPAKDA